MEVEAIKAKVKEAIQQVTGIDAATIPDSASYDQDLGLDSLAILEIAVCVEQHFRFQATDEELSSLRTIADSAELVRRKMLVEAP